jgi:hypothetical protein
MRGQGAVEYIIILGLIILIALIVVGSLSGFNITNFVLGEKERANEISHLLQDVAFRYSMMQNGYLQASARLNTASFIGQANLTIRKGSDNCTVIIQELTPDDWVTNDTNCDFLAGNVGSTYQINCTVSYVDEGGLLHKKTGLCIGVYEEGNGTAQASYLIWFTGNQSEFDQGNYSNTTWGSVMLSNDNTTGTYLSKVFNASETADWHDISWGLELTHELPNNKGSDAGVDMSNNVVLYHMASFGNQIIDYSGESNNAAMSGNPDCSVNGRFFEGCHFDGNDCAGAGASNSIINTNNFSFGTWFKTSYNHPVYGNEGRLINFHKESVAGSAIALYLEKDRVALIYNNDTTWKYKKYYRAYHDDLWHHFLVTHNDTSYAIYYDGLLIEIFDDSFSGMGSYPLKIASWDGTQRFFKGVLDEVEIYRRTLTSDEVWMRYIRGASKLNVTVRSCGNDSCIGYPWINTYSDPEGSDISVPVNQYFQYRFNFYTMNTTYSPLLKNVTVRYLT